MSLDWGENDVERVLENRAAVKEFHEKWFKNAKMSDGTPVVKREKAPSSSSSKTKRRSTSKKSKKSKSRTSSSSSSKTKRRRSTKKKKGVQLDWEKKPEPSKKKRRTSVKAKIEFTKQEILAMGGCGHLCPMHACRYPMTDLIPGCSPRYHACGKCGHGTRHGALEQCHH